MNMFTSIGTKKINGKYITACYIFGIIFIAPSKTKYEVITQDCYGNYQC